MLQQLILAWLNHMHMFDTESAQYIQYVYQ